MTLRPIGRVVSPIKRGQKMPPRGVPALIEVYEEFAEGLHRIEKHTHLWVMAWLDGAERDVLQVIPRGAAERIPENLHGVFSVRSPARPNPIGLTAVRVLGVDGLRIDVEPLDFLDGTEVIDIKPYFRSRDMIFAAVNEQLGQPPNREAARESLRAQAEQFMGRETPDAALTVRVLEHWRMVVLDGVEARDVVVTAPSDRPLVADVLMGVLGVTHGRGTLRFQDGGAIEFAHGGRRVRYHLIAQPGLGVDEIWEAADESLFRCEEA